MILVSDLGIQSYTDIWNKMKDYTLHRKENSTDKIWLLEHPPVYTQGQAGKAEHILNPQNIPVVQSDRGGQVTYHGPGQLVVYFMLDLRPRSIGIRTLVRQLETLIIELLQSYQINGETVCGAPGVYVKDKKIASIGLRVKHACTYHGIALNVAMDLSPFEGINPCGYKKLQMTQIKDFVPSITFDKVKNRMISKCSEFFDN